MNYATSTSGDRGTSVSGAYGTVVIAHFDDAGRKRLAIGYVGEDGIEPHKGYVVRDGKLAPK